MKKILTLLFLISTLPVLSQSNSYWTLKDTFSDAENVHSFRVSGFLCRAVLGMAGEYEFKEAIKEVRSIKLMVVPAKEFASRGLSVDGFTKILKKDSFEELATVKDRGDVVRIFFQQTDNKINRYFVLVEEPDEVIAIELKGTIDPNRLMSSTDFSQQEK